MRTGEISPEIRDSVSNIQGHSAAVVRAHYLKMDRTADAFRARSLLLPSDAVSAASPPPFAARSTYKHIVFGENHPHFADTDRSRIPWSDEELGYIAGWKQLNLVAPADHEGANSRCLRAIRDDTAAHPIFHKHHVETADRFRNGFERV